MAKGSHQASLNNRANQLNPTHSSYWSSRGESMPTSGLANLDNHANQKNPNNDLYEKYKDDNQKSEREIRFYVDDND